MAVHSEYSSHSLRWFLESSRPGGIARYRGRDSRTEDSMVFVPDHQREYVWPPAKQRLLIESVFKGHRLHLPPSLLSLGNNSVNIDFEAEYVTDC